MSSEPHPYDLSCTGQARAKIRPITELAALTEALRKQGRNVVLAHGVFDLLHLGHVRHLEEARSQGDCLVVTISADSVVNKGPGRPVFTELLRAEMLAALGIVDYVGISPKLGAEWVIEHIRPSVYAKGKEYAHATNDLTGRIVSEQKTVEKHGGRLFFTDDITFSSSELLNRYFQIYPPELHTYLETIRNDNAAEQILGHLEAIRNKRVLFVGDTIIDEYRYVEPLGKPSKENIIATRYCSSEFFCGGVIGAANYLAEFCAEIHIVTLLGTDPSFEDMIRESLHPNVHLHAFYREGAPTTRKQRMVDPTYTRKLFEVCYLDDTRLPDSLEKDICATIRKLAPECDLVAANDFGHGLISGGVVSALVETAPFLAVNAQTNSANIGYNLITKYPRADFICIDAPEARLAMADRESTLEMVVSKGLARKIDCPNFIITHGANGCVAHNRESGTSRTPAFTKSVIDTMGAGDAFFSLTSPVVAQGASIEHAAFVGNAIGAMKVGIVGHRSRIERAQLIKFITAMLK